MKRFVVCLLASLLVLGAAASGAYAEQCGCGGHMAKSGMVGGIHRGPRMVGGGDGFMRHSPGEMHFLWRKLMSLDLTEKQKGAMKEIKSRSMKESIKKRADLGIASIEMRDLLHKDSVDMGAVEAMLKKTESLRTDLRLSHIKARVEIKAILTPEQKKKFKEMLEKGHGTDKMMHGDMRMQPPTETSEGVQQDMDNSAS
jgi:Spy/CpxP family protein refolding chaperone